jgi:hypothetical protein
MIAENRLHAGWAIDGNDPAKKIARRIFFAPESPVEIASGAVLIFRMTHDSPFGDHNVGTDSHSRSPMPTAIRSDWVTADCPPMFGRF